MASPNEVIKQLGGYAPAPVGVVVDRRKPENNKVECLKLDTFENLTQTLVRIELKMEDKIQLLHERIDKLVEGMNSMIRLEEKILQHARDINSLESTIDELRKQKNDLELRINNLQNHFDSHKNQVGQYERLGWLIITGVGSIAGAYVMKQMGL
jgi:predicted RNase H-like nuclease (RuvC/YqgF family)